MQIVFEYVYCWSCDFVCFVFWVYVDNEMIFMQDYKVIVKRLGLVDGLGGLELLMVVCKQIEVSLCWLFIFDNVDNFVVFGVGWI